MPDPTHRPNDLGSIARIARSLTPPRNETTVRNWAFKRWFSVYRVPGIRGLLVSKAEVEAAIAEHADEIRPGYANYDGLDVIDLPRLTDEQAATVGRLLAPYARRRP